MADELRGLFRPRLKQKRFLVRVVSGRSVVQPPHETGDRSQSFFAEKSRLNDLPGDVPVDETENITTSLIPTEISRRSSNPTSRADRK
jgi:hypothetical protein